MTPRFWRRENGHRAVLATDELELTEAGKRALQLMDDSDGSEEGEAAGPAMPGEEDE